jgi:hypothetical protein
MTRHHGAIPIHAVLWSPAPGWVTWHGEPVFVGTAAEPVDAAVVTLEAKPTAREEEYQEAKT